MPTLTMYNMLEGSRLQFWAACNSHTRQSQLHSRFYLLAPRAWSERKTSMLTLILAPWLSATILHHGTYVAIIIPVSVSTGAAAKVVKDLKTEVATFRAETFADNTKWTCATDRNSYFDFCAKLGVAPELASQEMIATYAAYLAWRLKSSSVCQYLNILRIVHLEAGLVSPLKDNWYISSTLKGIDRVKDKAVNRKSPITPDIQFRIKVQLTDTNSFDVLFWAAFLLMFFCLFRKSNLFTKGAFHMQKQFMHDSFILNMNKSQSVVVRWSKAIQHREHEQKMTLPAIYPLCPVTAECMQSTATNRWPRRENAAGLSQ